jgi:hypothetical protein
VAPANPQPGVTTTRSPSSAEGEPSRFHRPVTFSAMVADGSGRAGARGHGAGEQAEAGVDRVAQRV